MSLSANDAATQFLDLYREGNHHVLGAFESILREYWQGLSANERCEKLKDGRFNEIAQILGLDHQGGD